MSQPPNTRSFKPASGTKSLILGERASVRLPSRIAASCVSEPIGAAIPWRMASTPAINVVDTAPIPGIRTPSLPSAGAIWAGFLVDKNGELLVELVNVVRTPPHPLGAGSRHATDDVS